MEILSVIYDASPPKDLSPRSMQTHTMPFITGTPKRQAK